MRQRHPGSPRAVHLSVVVNVIDAEFPKEPLSSREFALHRDQRAVAVAPVQICDGAEQVRKLRKEICHAAALVVDQEKAHFLRRELQGERENQAL